MSLKVAAGIILYNPEVNRLVQNVDAIEKQVLDVFLIDNNSSNVDQVVEIFSSNKKITVIKNNKNEGVAYALNQIINLSLSLGYEWVLMLDQDSIVPNNIIESYSSLVNIYNVAMVTCRIYDENLCQEISGYDIEHDYCFVKTCITSASLNKTSVIKALGGYDEHFFIDCVDHEMTKRLVAHNYLIVRDNKVILKHTVGKSRMVKFKGVPFVVSFHSPIRNYYRIRNHILLARKYKEPIKEPILWGLQHAFLTIKYDNHKLYNFFYIIKAFFDGLLMKMDNGRCKI